MAVKERHLDAAGWKSLEKVLDERRPFLSEQIRRRLSRFLRGRIDPEDVLSNVCIRARKRWEDFQTRHVALDPAARPYDAWLKGLVWDCLIEAYRRHTAAERDVRAEVRFPEHSGSQLLLGLISPHTSPSGAAVRAETEERLAQVIGKLKESDQELLWLRYFEGLPFAAVAVEMGLTETNVGVKHLRAVRRMRDLWKELYGSEGLQP